MNWIEQHDAFDQKDLLESILHDLGEAVRLERIATNKGFRHCKNLETALRSLGLVLLMLGRKQECMSTVAEQHYWLSRQMPFALEDKGKAAIIPNFDWIHGVASNGEKRRVLLKTNDLDRPILQPNEIEVILEAVDRQRQLSSEETSRFTMQYSGNADFHLSDLCQVDPEVQDIVDSMLQTKLYPLVRRAFGSTVPSAPLCVYDALVVRYDSDEAIRNGKEGASLPLHRDGGMFTVNILLNQKFEGGGTFFDGLLENRQGDTPVQHPVAPGQALAHLANERHAGAPITCGIRQVMVVFLTTKEATKTERASYLRIMGEEPKESRIKLLCHANACRDNPQDSEAHFWTGYYILQQKRLSFEDICHAVDHLELSVENCPTDCRSLVCLGSAYQSRWHLAQKLEMSDFDSYEEVEKMIGILQRAARVEQECRPTVPPSRSTLRAFIRRSPMPTYPRTVLRKHCIIYIWLKQGFWRRASNPPT